METSQNITELLRKICVQGSTVIMVTHNMQIVEKYPGRVFRCKDHRLEEITQKNKEMNDAEKELANEPDSNDQNHTHREDNIHFNYDV
jgi:cell division transport system ATP-binding protein